MFLNEMGRFEQLIAANDKAHCALTYEFQRFRTPSIPSPMINARAMSGQSVSQDFVLYHPVFLQEPTEQAAALRLLALKLWRIHQG
jgi:hypothetical protein